jgi:alanine racemase
MHTADTGRSRAEPSSHTASAILTVDLAAIVANYDLLRREVGGAGCAAVVKADAYGLGADRVAPALARAGCRRFFVAQVEEGVALRAILGPDVEIAVLNGTTPGSEGACVGHCLVPVLNTDAQRRAWVALAGRLDRRLPAILQVDTGMARFGFAQDEFDRMLEDSSSLAGIEIRLVMSHLACADEPGSPANDAQRQAFDRARRRLPGVPASLAASSGIFLGPDFHYDLVRPGAALYGIAPRAGRPNPMSPVVTLQARVLQVRSVPAGTRVGYGHSELVRRESRLATIAIGYADGFLRSASGAGEARSDGCRLPLVGRVSMDSIILDATDAPPDAVRSGSLVELVGPERDVDAVASAAGTIGYEVLTGLGHRFYRTYLDA